MARKNCRAPATTEQVLTCLRTHCGGCDQPIAVAYRTQRTITTLQGSCRLTLRVRRCGNPACEWYHQPYRPEEEGKWALPHGEFGLDVIALIGTLCYTAHRSIPEIHQELRDRGVSNAERTVTHLLSRYEELVALHLTDQTRLRERFVEQGYAWVHRAAHVLSNDDEREASAVRQTYETLLTEMEHAPISSESLTAMLCIFRKVTMSYWPGLFHCYDLPDLPRTNNELEQYFGSARYYERRASGRKQASPGMVVRGAVRVVASVASRLHAFSGAELCPADLPRWRILRWELNHRHEARRLQRFFRTSPESYLAALEEKLSKERLPT